MMAPVSQNTGSALVVGAGGVIGRAILDHFAVQPGWQTIAASRTPSAGQPGVDCLAMDLLDPADCRAKLAGSDVTHVFYAAYLKKPAPAEETEVNLRMLVNLVDALEAEAPRFGHINLTHGQKWYGNHLGPYRTPAKEDDPRHLPPNFYYDQQDFIAERQLGKSWTWSAIRPQAPLGFSIGSPMNQVLILGLYGSICRELGVPLEFPGSEGCFNALYQVTDVALLGRAVHWIATTPSCANEPFNVTNGDLFRWCNLWPRIAEFFDVSAGTVRRRPLARTMADKGPLWDRIVAKHGLQAHRMEDLVDWSWGDFVFGSDFDNVSSTVKLRQHGFYDFVDSEDSYISALSKLRENRIIP